MMNGRWFGGRQLIVELWDGEVNYQVEETEKEHEARMNKWQSYLESSESSTSSSSSGGTATKPETENNSDNSSTDNSAHTSS